MPPIGISSIRSPEGRVRPDNSRKIRSSNSVGPLPPQELIPIVQFGPRNALFNRNTARKRFLRCPRVPRLHLVEPQYVVQDESKG